MTTRSSTLVDHKTPKINGARITRVHDPFGKDPKRYFAVASASFIQRLKCSGNTSLAVRATTTSKSKRF